MDSSYQQIGELIARVRARWRRLLVFRAGGRAALTTAAVLIGALAAARLIGRSPNALAAIGVVAGVAMLAAIIRALKPVRQRPSDRQVARFIEEHEPSLDDRLVSAVDVATVSGSANAPALAGMMLADADRRAAAVEPSTIITGEVLRRAGFQAVGALLLLAAVGWIGRGTARQSADALSLALFPSHVTLEVKPGNARLPVGTPLTIEARLIGNQAPVAAQLQRAGEDGWVAADMPQDESGVFRAALEAVAESFKYRVVAGGFASPAFEITVARPPRITRIDVEYQYPDGLGLKPRKEEDGGDIYAPSGTSVRLLVHTDREVASGEMSLGAGRSVGLSPSRATLAADDGGGVLEAALTIERDDSYRVRVADREGLSAPGETEYFIRMLDDRPPEVRVLRPARDRNVTRLEEVDIQAEAQDDFGIERLDLVYSVRGGKDQVVPLIIPKQATTVSGAHTLYLEDLDVKPGDFVSYYVRARDLARGRRSSEARSDIFFLEVKPFEQEFTLAQSQAMGGGSGSPQLDDLVSAQKEIIVATWKLDRRTTANGAKSDQDIKSVGRAEAELKTRVEETASSFRESTMRDPRRRQPTPGAPRAGQTMPEEDSMTAAALAMGKAVGSLQALKTKDALPPELEALNHLLKAQGQVKEKQITRQTGNGAGGSNRTTQDLSSLFDKELQRHQQTNYETPTSSEQKADTESSMLDKIRELAQRQDELLRRQQELARQREKLSAEELKRALESLTREQSELRQRAEDMARKMSRQGEPSDAKQKGQPGSQSQAGERNQAGQQSGGEQGQSSGQSQSGQSRDGQQASARGGDHGNRMRDVSEEMRSAASELRREDPSQATERGNRALEKLRALEKQLQSGAPDERRRAMGDMQLEARQLADGQRQVSSELGRVGQGDDGRDAVRRLAGEQERLSERVQRLQKNLDSQGSAPSQPSNAGAKNGSGRDGADAQRAAADAAREIERQRLSERMRQSAEQMRAAAGAGAREQAGQPGGGRPTGDGQASLKNAAGAQEEIARSLDRLADRLGAATGTGDDESKKLTGQMAKAQELRERMDGISKKLEQLGQAGGRQGNQQGQQGQPGAEGSQGQPTGQPGAKPGGSSGGQQQGGQSQASESQSGQSSSEQASGQSSGQSGQGSALGTGPGGEVARLRDEYTRQLQETRELLDQLRRDDQTFGQSGAGLTFEGQGMTLSAPGTESFKQDFARWEQLRKQATQALELAESSIAKKLQAKESRDRLAAGVDDRPPAEYTQQVDSYFKSLAGKKSR